MKHPVAGGIPHDAVDAFRKARHKRAFLFRESEFRYQASEMQKARQQAGPLHRQPTNGRGISLIYIRSIIAWPNPEHETCVAPVMSRAKS